MPKFYIGNSLLRDELAIAQQLICDILTCFADDVLDTAPLPHLWRAAAPHRGASFRPYGGGKRCPIAHRGAPYTGGKFGAL